MKIIIWILYLNERDFFVDSHPIVLPETTKVQKRALRTMILYRRGRTGEIGEHTRTMILFYLSSASSYQCLWNKYVLSEASQLRRERILDYIIM